MCLLPRTVVYPPFTMKSQYCQCYFYVGKWRSDWLKLLLLLEKPWQKLISFLRSLRESVARLTLVPLSLNPDKIVFIKETVIRLSNLIFFTLLWKMKFLFSEVNWFLMWQSDLFFFSSKGRFLELGQNMHSNFGGKFSERWKLCELNELFT